MPAVPRVIDPVPVLETKRLRLRALRLSDAAALFDIYADPQSAAWMGREPMGTVQQMEEKLTRDLENVRAGTSVLYAVTARDGGDEAIGISVLFKWDQNIGSVEYGYALVKREWGKGYVTELTPPVVAFAFDGMKANRVEAHVDVANVASVRVLKRAGFVLEGIQREKTRAPDGKLSGLAIYSMLASERPTSR